MGFSTNRAEKTTIDTILANVRQRYHALPPEDRPALDCGWSAVGLFTRDEIWEWSICGRTLPFTQEEADQIKRVP